MILSALKRQNCLALILATLYLIGAQAHAETEFKSSEPEHQLSFQFEGQSTNDRTLIARVEKQAVFERLRLFGREDLKLEQNIIFHIQHPFDTEQKNGRQTTPDSPLALHIYLPFSFLYQLDQGLINKYPEQADVRELIYSAAVEKYLWFELGRSLIEQFELNITGKEIFALDSFSTLMLINQNQHSSDYILDATEAFLLISQSTAFTGNESNQEEISLDEQRYRKAVCLILGKDYLTHLNANQESYRKLLDDLTWDLEKIEQCQKLYTKKLKNWLTALQPHLRDKSKLKQWLVAQ